MGSCVDNVPMKEFRFEIDKIRWATRMRIDFSRHDIEWGREAVHCLTARFARWPEEGTLVVSHPTTWWDHLKKTLWSRYPIFRGAYRPFRSLAWSETKTTYKAAMIVPNVDLPDDLRRDSFCVFVNKWR